MTKFIIVELFSLVSRALSADTSMFRFGMIIIKFRSIDHDIRTPMTDQQKYIYKAIDEILWTVWTVPEVMI